MRRRTWNVTGLYKASRDRAPGRRSRRIRSSASAATLVPIDRSRDIMLCRRCMGESERRRLLDGEACPFCRLVGGLSYTGRNAGGL